MSSVTAITGWIMGSLVRQGLVAFGMMLLVAIPGTVCAADVLVQGEDAIAGGPVERPGYAFADPREETANWASVNCSPNPGFPNAPGRFAVDFAGLPPGPYRVWVRLARFNGTPDTVAVPGATFSDNHGHQAERAFVANGTEESTRPFVMQPGGIIKAGGQWTWLPLFQTGPLQGVYELTIIGQTGPVGTGNYKGLWIDSIRFEDLSGSRFPRSMVEAGLPGRWEGMPWLTTSSPMRRGLSSAVPVAKDRMEPSLLLRRVFEPSVAATDSNLFCVWLMVHQHIPSLRLALADEHGRRIEADLCRLAGDRPLRLGTWYCVLWPLQVTLSKAAKSSRWSTFEVRSAGASVDGGAISVHGLSFTTGKRLRQSLENNSADCSVAGKENLRRSLAVHSFPRQSAGQDKRVILWVQGPYGGNPNATIVKARIAELYNSGADGIVMTVNPVVDGKELYFPNEFFSPRRFRDEDFAAEASQLREVAWGPLAHSLLRLNVMPGTVDWFASEWSAILAKARQAARMAKVGRLAGIMFDVEQYDWERGVFRYENRPLKGTKSLGDYAAQAKLRGQQIAQAMAGEFSDIDVLTTFGSSIGADGGQLLVPFLEGMASVGKCHVYDGCEPAYRFRTLRPFLEASETMRLASRTVGIGFGLWVNPPEVPFSFSRPEENYRSPEGLACSLHYALRLSDKYVWLYREGNLSLWPDTTPPAYYEAIRRSRLPQDPLWVPLR
jgi:hypothetical protein